jgi:hypothetical protein
MSQRLPRLPTPLLVLVRVDLQLVAHGGVDLADKLVGSEVRFERFGSCS